MIRQPGLRLGLVTAGVLAVSALLALPAGAHQPVFVTEADRTPATGPLLEDGNLSFAVYGTITRAKATRGFRSRLKQGQPLIADLLIPDLAPEQNLAIADLPRVTITEPDGTRRQLASNLRVPFDEPFSKTRYLRIVQLREPARQSGVYRFSVSSRTPSRFTLATGVVEGAVGIVTNAKPAPANGLAGWYSTPPSTSAPRDQSQTDQDRPTSAGSASDTSSETSSGSATGIWIGAAVMVGIGIALIALMRARRNARRTPPPSEATP